MCINFEDSYVDNYDNLFCGEKNHFPFSGELNGENNDLNSQNQNDFFKEEKPFSDNDFGFSYYSLENPLPFYDIENIKKENTEPTSLDKQNVLLNQKRQREEPETKKEDKEIILVEENKKEITEEKEEEMEQKELGLEEDEPEKQTDNGSKKGRRKKEGKYDSEAKHDKFRQDNIMRKIKTFIFKYILNKLNESLKDTNLKFYALDAKLSEELKKDFNEKLLDRTIGDIYSKSDLNKKFKNMDNSNQDIIKKILKEKNPKKTISLLGLKYKDILNIIRDKDMKEFLESIREKEERNKNQNIELYMESVEYMIMNYENWFFTKKGRNKK